MTNRGLVCSLCGVLLIVSPVRAQEIYDVLLIAGQSNAVGYDAKPGDLPANPVDAQVMFWFKTGDPPPDEHDSSSGGKWTTLRPQPLGMPKQPREGRQYGNFAQAEGGFGPEMGIARTLLAAEPAGPTRKLAVIKAAFSGTGLAADWNPDDPGDAGACYRTLIAETRQAMMLARADGHTLQLRGFFWVQGESDANAQDAPKYHDRLGHLLRSLRRDLEAPALPAFLSINAQFGMGNNPFVPQVIAAQQALDADDPLNTYVDTADVAIINGAHWSSAGTLEAGQRLGKAFLAYEAMLQK
jgi:hypothetical protein